RYAGRGRRAASAARLGRCGAQPAERPRQRRAAGRGARAGARARRRHLAGATLVGPGRVRHLGFGPTQLAEMVGARSLRAEAIARLRDAAGLRAGAAEAVAPLVWSKLIGNVAINPLGTLLHCTNGQVAEDPAAGELLARLVLEAAAVARAAGVALPVADPVEHVRTLARLTYYNRNSTLQDFEAGRRTEVDGINGAVAALGAQLGVPTPLNDAMALLIHALERRGR